MIFLIGSVNAQRRALRPRPANDEVLGAFVRMNQMDVPRYRHNSTFKVCGPNAKRLKGRRRLDVPGPRKNSKRVNSNRYKEEQCKKAVRARDNFQCQFPRCFVRSRSIDVHHIAMRSKRPDLKFARENCIALC